MTKIIFLLIFALIAFQSCKSHQHSHDHHHGHSHHGSESPSYKYSREANTKPQDHSMDAKQIWTDTILAVFLISIAPALILKLIPDLATNEKLLKILLGFAAGGLLGDAFFHLIPHSMEEFVGSEHSHSHSHSHGHGHEHSHDLFNDPHMKTSLYVLCGILCFLLIEKTVRLIKNDSGHGHSHSPAPKKDEKSKNKKEQSSKPATESTGFKVSGYLNLAADFFHNFTDGLAIAASFMVSRNVGIITTLTVLVHELPHEIGDFAILVQAGCTTNKAILLQLVTAFGAFTGAALSLVGAGLCPSSIFGHGVQSIVAAQSQQMATKILPFTAGGFIYIALVTVMPELLGSSRKFGLVQSLLELFALLLGVGLMILVSLYE